MKLSNVALLVSACTALTFSLPTYAEGHANSAVRWVIDTNGVPHKNKFDSFDGWFNKALPYGQKAVAISGSYFHYKPNTSQGAGYAYDEFSSFVISDSGNAYRDSAQGWQNVSGCWQAKDISSHTLENAYCVTGDGTLKQYNQQTNSFDGYISIANEQISKIDVSSEGHVWAVTDSKKIFKYANNTWTAVETGCNDSCWPTNIAVGADKVYVVAQHRTGPGMGSTDLFTLENNQLNFYGNYIEVDIDRDNNFWGITSWDLKLLYKKPGMTDAQPYYSFPSWRVTAQNIGG